MENETIWRYTSVISITLAAAGGIITYYRKRVNAVFYPFLLCLVAGSCNEMLVLVHSFAAPHNNNDNTPLVLNNIYILVEFILLSLFFARINRGNKKWQLFLFVIVTLLCLVWVYEALVKHKITAYCSLPYFLFSVTLSTFAFRQLSMQFWSNYSELQSKYISFVCIVFVVFYTYCAFVMSMYVFIPFSEILLLEKKYGYFSAITLILKIVNLLSNLSFVILFIWINFRQKYLTA